jgi:hypothetical protein
MSIREKLRNSPGFAAWTAGVFVLVAIGVLTYSYWPEKKANPLQGLYSDDDGQTWFADNIFKVAPFDHNGKTAVVAQVYSYDDGKKKFCLYVSRFTPEAKKQLETAIAEAQKNGQSPGSIGLYKDRGFMTRSMEVKLAGPNHPWIRYDDPKAQDVFAIHSPDGSDVDQVFAY